MFDTSLHLAKYLWAVPVLGVLAYDIFVPETVIIKRSVEGNVPFKNISEISIEEYKGHHKKNIRIS